MRVLKNLLGDNSKIHADEIAVALDLLLSESVIVERGSNSNGQYVRFGNGTQIVYGEVSYNFDVGGDQSKQLPATFADRRVAFNFSPSNVSYELIDDSALIVAGLESSRNQMRIRYSINGPPSKAKGTNILAYSAIGNWKENS